MMNRSLNCKLEPSRREILGGTDRADRPGRRAHLAGRTAAAIVGGARRGHHFAGLPGACPIAPRGENHRAIAFTHHFAAILRHHAGSRRGFGD